MEDLSTDGTISRSVPSVSRERWHAHVLTKLNKGYRLIIGERKSANFHHPAHGYETCSHEVARKMVLSGEVVAVGTHRLGTIYALPVLTAAPSRAPVARRPDEDDAYEADFAPLDLSDFGADMEEIEMEQEEED